jgi:hypothetical protein
MTPLADLFPEQGSMGSIINSFEPVVTERVQGLQSYLKALLQLSGIFTQPALLDFLDISGKGTSACPKKKSLTRFSGLSGFRY